MATFNEFRNSFPESSNEKGERFEIFLSEWMFKHHPVLSSQFKKVWRFSEWPKAWSQKDLGTDLIAEDQHGKICAIQAKFYKEKNSIPKSHIDSFLSDSNRPEVDYRYLIATTDNLGANAIKTIQGQEKPVHTFMLQQFNEEFEWPKSIGSLETYQPRKPHQPRPHQMAAIEDVCAKLGKRGQLLMACGTGKTLTGQRIAESLGSKSTLVLLPSLLLLSKTVADWVGEKEKGFIYLPVCSDKSATKKTDEISLNNHELPFQSTTDSSEIAAFLHRSENKVIFSTYQSSPQIAEAFRAESLKPFDLIIADEAHRCAGRVSSDYSTVLSEALIPAKKRLFMTATPRTYSSRLQKSAMDAEIQVASMDDEEVFGPVLHHLTFGQAIENDPPLLTDYRVVVVGVNDALVREQVEERAFVKTQSGLEDDARSLAIQIGLSKAIKDYDLKRIISFHGRVNSAAEFAASFKRLQDDLKSDSKPPGKIEYGYVSGSMPTSQRTRELRALGELANEDRYIVGNARCLSEGVDVPALDGVAFVDPKRSEIDIVQAVGRAIRLAKGKSFGTIVIPVFISDEDDPEEALSTSEFDQVWKVVNALRSHDETLGETLDELRVGLGKKAKVSLNGTKMIFDVPSNIDNRFIEAFETRLIETTTETWSFWYGLLSDYFQRFGDSNVPHGYEIDGHQLGTWVGNCRARASRLSPAKIALLTALDFIFDPYTARWQEGIMSLKSYVKQNGDCLVPRNYTVNGYRLGLWVSRQRTNKKRLTQNRIDQLDTLGFVWDTQDLQWATMVSRLAEYKKLYGHIRIHKAPEYGSLASWAENQRKNATRLTTEQTEKLDALGFAWDPFKEKFDQGKEELEKYSAAFGDCDVKQTYQTADGFRLGTWVNTQRTARTLGNLTPERIDELDDIGFIWNAKENRWDEGLALLKQFLENEGHCNVPRTHLIGNFNLGNWVTVQRRDKEKLPSNKIAQLEQMSFIWEPRNVAWEEGYQHLCQFKARYNHTLVTVKYMLNDYPLGRWVNKQRSNRSSLDKSREQKLDELDFVWSHKDSEWTISYEVLGKYVELHGDSFVPEDLIFYGIPLGKWVKKQRRASSQLPQDQRDMLDRLGFEWEA